MFLRGDTWHYDFIVNGIRYRGTTGFKKNEKTKAAEVETKLKVQAREKQSIQLVWEQTKRKLMEGKTLAIDTEIIWNEYLKKGTSRAGTKRQKLMHRYLKEFCRWMKENYPEIKSLSSVTSTHAQEYIMFIKSIPGANATKNEYLKAVKMIFRAIGKDFGVVENPFEGIPPMPRNGATRDAFSKEEIALIGSKAKGWIYSLCLTAHLTGLREGDICMMEKKFVNLKTGWISLQTRKTHVDLDILILPDLKKHFEEVFAKYPDSKYVFPELAEKYLHDRNNIGRKVKEFFVSIGIKDSSEEIPGYKNKVSKKDIHSFRHTYAYVAAEYGIPLPVVQKTLGHLDDEMTKHYMDHASRSDRTKYLQKFPNYFSAPQPETKAVFDIEKVRPLSVRIADMIRKVTPDNLERNRKRILKLLEKL